MTVRGIATRLLDDPVSPCEPRSCCGRARLRKDWDNILTHDPLGDRISREETLWVVLFTMGIATNRDEIMQILDLERWVLDFFMIWGPVSASVLYSSRFNDVDTFHHALWALFLFGMAGQIACFNHSLRGMAAFTSVLYALIGLAFLRVACMLPRARRFCAFFGASCGVAAALSATIACIDLNWGLHVRGFMWMNVLWETVTNVSFFVVTEYRLERKRAWDVPVCLEYIVKRYEGFHMMIMVCSFLFPLALQGALFASDPHARAVVLLGNTYAVALKLGLLDVDEVPIERHAIRRSRPTAIGFLCVHPVGMLGIGITGVGFVAAVQGVRADFTTTALCLGPAITWFVTGVTKLLHEPLSNAQVHTYKAVALCSASFVFLAPLAFRLDVDATPWFVVANMAVTLLVQLFIEYANGSALGGWRASAPRLLIDWDTIGERVGARVSSMEHFFTVLCAVAVFVLNQGLGHNHDVQLYVLKFFVLFGMLAHTMHYAMRFADDDGVHKVLWGAFQFGLLLLLEGFDDVDQTAPYSLFKFLAFAMYMFVGVGFSGRIIIRLPRARRTATYFSLAALAAATLMATTLPIQGFGLFQMYAVAAIALFADPLLSLLNYGCTSSEEARRRIAMPVNAEYLVSRWESLQIDVMAVAIVVPNTLFPTSSATTACVVCGDALTCFMAIALKASLFDVAPPDLGHHAVALKERARHLFFLSQMFITLGISLTGGAMNMLLQEVSASGASGRSDFAQRLMPAAVSLTLAAFAVSGLSHAPCRRSVHRAKAVVGFNGAIALALWPMYGAGATAFETVTFVVGLTSLVVASQLCLRACWPSHL